MYTLYIICIQRKIGKFMNAYKRNYQRIYGGAKKEMEMENYRLQGSIRINGYIFYINTHYTSRLIFKFLHIIFLLHTAGFIPI